MSIKNRMLFVAGSIDNIRPLLLGDLNIGDKIYSDAGLVAIIKDYKAQYYEVSILEGSAFERKHEKEITFNRILERYIIHGENLTKWRREEIAVPGRNILHPTTK